MNADRRRKMDAKAARKRKAHYRRGKWIAGLILHGWGTAGARLTDGTRLAVAYREQGKLAVFEPITTGAPITIGEEWHLIDTTWLHAFHRLYVEGKT